MTSEDTVTPAPAPSSRRGFLLASLSLPTLAGFRFPLEALGAGNTASAASGAPAKALKGIGTGTPTLGGARKGTGAPGLKGAFEPLAYGGGDDVSVAKGFRWYALASRGDVINAQGDRFGDCCDFTHFFAGAHSGQGFLWVNHEYILDTLLYGKPVDPRTKTKEQVDAEMKLVGGSYLELIRVVAPGGKVGHWEVVRTSTLAFRVDAHTPIPMVGPAGGRTAVGTMGNCSGGHTPWGTILTCEENVESYFHEDDGVTYGWGRYHQRPVEDYGWVVEVDPATKTARKLTGLGRFAHEGATVVARKGAPVVVYLGDDARFECVYKFVSRGVFTGDKAKDKDLLVEGDLYVANLKKAVWEKLSPENKKLAADKEGRFKTQAEIVTNARAAAKVAGGTPVNRAEGIAVHPRTRVVLVALTNNDKAGDIHGSVLAIREDRFDHAALSFSFDTYVTGGLQAGFSCPDNICFGPKESLWIGTDISAGSLGSGAHREFARNSVFRLEDDTAGNVYARHFLQAPAGAECTGPCFSGDGKAMFVSIQHPGEGSLEEGNATLSSHWPRGGNEIPLSTVIVVEEKGARFA